MSAVHFPTFSRCSFIVSILKVITLQLHRITPNKRFYWRLLSIRAEPPGGSQQLLWTSKHVVRSDSLSSNVTPPKAGGVAGCPPLIPRKPRCPFYSANAAVFWCLLGVMLPAVHHHRAGVGGSGGFHPPDESQQPGGVIRHPVVGPGGEVELTHLVLGGVSPLSRHTLCVRCQLLHLKAP